MFPRNPLAFGQKFAHRAMVPAFAFAQGKGLRHRGDMGQASAMVSLSCHISTPSPTCRPDLNKVGPFFLAPSRGRRSADRQGFAHGARSRGFGFHLARNPVDSSVITNAHGGRATCVSHPFFLPSPWQPALQAACKPQPSAALSAPLWALLRRMQWTKTWLRARPLAALPALQPAAFRACSPAKPTDLTRAPARGSSITIKTTWADRPGGLFFCCPWPGQG